MDNLGWMQAYAIKVLEKRYNAKVDTFDLEGEQAYRVENTKGIAIYVDRGYCLQLVEIKERR